MSNQKDIESKKVALTEADFKARRRLLKVSAAAPLIATLSPNAALAQAQGSLTCAQKNKVDTNLQDVDPYVAQYVVSKLHPDLVLHPGGQEKEGAGDLVKVVQRFAHPHVDEVGDPFPCVGVEQLSGAINLGDDLAGGQMAAQP